MTTRTVVVGSGASGVHFALSLLKKGRPVTMVDVGRSGVPAVEPSASFAALKQKLDDPAAYFLGSRFEGVLLPDADEEYYGIPPGKDYVFELAPGFSHASHGLAPLFSFASGGLAEAWTAGCYPFNDDELADFPFSYRDIEPHYEEVARRIGITGEVDDLSRFMPVHDHLLPPLTLDPHSRVIVERYAHKRGRLNRDLGAYLGRTRVATLTRDMGTRKACAYLGRCLWGCPIEALYTPSHTLTECQSYPEFEYVRGAYADHFTVGRDGRIRSLVVRTDRRASEEVTVDTLVLAAGTLSSSRIVLKSVFRATGERIRLHGLMDNRQVLVPFVNLRMIGKPVSTDNYQYHLLGMGIEGDAPGDYVHAQITTLKTALLHPVIQKLPFDLRTATLVTRSLRTALGVVNVNFRDTRRDENFVALGNESGDSSSMEIHYSPSGDEPARLHEGMRKVRQALRVLGCVVPPRMAHVRPMGASVHYAGTLPMSRERAPWTTTEFCQSRDFENLYLVDGSTYPFLPAKNLTFTLMANAVRVAAEAF